MRYYVHFLLACLAAAGVATSAPTAVEATTLPKVAATTAFADEEAVLLASGRHFDRGHRHFDRGFDHRHFRGHHFRHDHRHFYGRGHHFGHDRHYYRYRHDPFLNYRYYKGYAPGVSFCYRSGSALVCYRDSLAW